MIIGLKSEHFDKYFNYSTKQYMVLVWCLFDRYYSNVKIKLLNKDDKRSRADIVIDIDNKEDTIWNIEKSISDYEEDKSLKKFKSLFNFNFGTRITWPLGPNYALTNPIGDFIQLYTAKELADELNKNKKSIVKKYMHFLISSKVGDLNKTRLLNMIEETGEHIGYYRAVCNKHKIKYNIIPYIQNMYIIHLLFRILDDYKKEEYSREEVVTLHNKLEIYRFSKKSNPTYYLVNDILINKFIYSIKLHNYKDQEDNKEKEIVLVNVICKKTKENEIKVRNIKKLVKERYPKIKASLRVDYLTR